MRVNAQRLHESLRQLAQIGATPGGGVTRLALSSEDQSALFAYQHRFLDPTEIKQVGPRALKVSAPAQ